MIQGLNTRGIKGAAVPLALMYRLFAKDFRVYLFDRRQELPDAVTVQELAQILPISESTIRRDLTALHARGQILKVASLPIFQDVTFKLPYQKFKLYSFNYLFINR